MLLSNEEVCRYSRSLWTYYRKRSKDKQSWLVQKKYILKRQLYIIWLWISPGNRNCGYILICHKKLNLHRILPQSKGGEEFLQIIFESGLCSIYSLGWVQLHSPQETFAFLNVFAYLCAMPTSLVHINMNLLSKWMEKNVIIKNKQQ